MSGTYYQHDLSLMVLISFSWLRQSLPGFSLGSYFCPSSYCALWKQVTKCGPHLWGRELCSTSLRMVCLHQLFGMLYGRFVSSPSFIYSTTYLDQYELMDIFSLGYNPILRYLFCCSNCSSFGHWEFFQLALVFLCYTPIILFFECFLFSDTIRCSRLILYILCASPRICHSPLKIHAENGEGHSGFIFKLNIGSYKVSFHFP